MARTSPGRLSGPNSGPDPDLALRGVVAGVRGNVGETGVPRDWWATAGGIDEFFGSVPKAEREGVEVGQEEPEEAGMPGVEVGPKVPEEAEIKGVEGGIGVAEEVAEETSEVVVEGDDQVAEDERTPEMMDDEKKLSESRSGTQTESGSSATGGPDRPQRTVRMVRTVVKSVIPTSDRCRPEL
ncbi:Hypothetical predicted protein [Olea europaea subsp. europaea]|uniref:Uncharacterized protein n=1 Tax=Olea europaea subsp. europaea TaxID=158383 RepID=A0A8S0R512_OLEEU|nr:Hypothetical predicted protein [Olea europaea subsp. europaea]